MPKRGSTTSSSIPRKKQKNLNTQTDNYEHDHDENTPLLSQSTCSTQLFQKTPDVNHFSFVVSLQYRIDLCLVTQKCRYNSSNQREKLHVSHISRI